MSLSTEQETRLSEILDLCAENEGGLTKWERDFTFDLREKYEQNGSEILVTGKMWAILDRIEEKLSR